MWWILLATVLSLGQVPAGQTQIKPSQSTVIKGAAKALKTAKMRHARAVRKAEARRVAHDPKLVLAAFKRHLAQKGSPGEVQFIEGMIWGESRGKNKAVNFHPGRWATRKGKRVWVAPLWYCGPVQTLCRSKAQCERVKSDPRYAASEALRILRIHDAIGGDRTCNWKHGPNHQKCRTLRAGKPAS